MSVLPSDVGVPGSLPPGPDLARVLIFVLEGREYALPLEAIVEVVGYRKPTTVPGAGSDILGILPWRGRMVTIVDGRARLGLPAGRDEARARLIMLRDEGEWMALLVDGVSRVEALAGGERDGVLLLEPAVFLQEKR